MSQYMQMYINKSLFLYTFYTTGVSKLVAISSNS